MNLQAKRPICPRCEHPDDWHYLISTNGLVTTFRCDQSECTRVFVNRERLKTILEKKHGR